MLSHMSPAEIKYLLLGFIPLAFITMWLLVEVKGASRVARVISGMIAGISFTVWLGAFSNSLGSYYDGMREHRMLQSVIRAYPRHSNAINAWEAEYQFYKSSEYHRRKCEDLEAIIQADR